MLRRPPSSKRNYPLFPYTTLFRSPFRLTSPSPIAHSTHEPDRFFVDFRHIPSTVVNLGREISSISSAVMKRSGWWACSQINRSEEHTSDLQSLMRISYAVFCLKKKQHNENKESHIVRYTEII